jgi:hypothetical protein
MKSKTKLKTIFLIILGIITVTPVLQVGNLISTRDNNALFEPLNLSKVSGKIRINNNWSAAKAAGICTGDGSSENPYLLENLIIDGGGVGSCIYIENSNDYFMILNCSLNNAEDDDIMMEQAGIKLVNSSNGQLINNTISNPGAGSVGLLLYSSNDTTFIGNVINGNHERGFRMVWCHNIFGYLNNIRGQIPFFYQYSTFRFFSERRITYIYKGRTFRRFMGNFWSSYSDEQILFSNGGEHLIDAYPLIDPIENYEIIGFAGETIPGYNLLFLLGILSIISIFPIRRIKKQYQK